MKVKQRVSRTEVTEIELEFPIYIQHDVGDSHTYIVTYRYELQNPRLPTFLVTKITQSDRGYEVEVGQSLSIDSDVAANRIDERQWLEAVEQFEKWSRDCLKKLRVLAVAPQQ